MTKHMKFIHFNLSLLLLFVTSNAVAVELSGLIKDHMVVQRGQPFLLVGVSPANSSVQVSAYGNTFSTTADKHGAWSVKLPTQPASGPHSWLIEDANSQVAINNIMVGEVWLASGQSNMEWKFKWGVNDGKHEVAHANYPNIRYFDVKNRYTPKPQQQLDKDDKWVVASPQTANEFSAVAWHFAKSLHLDKNVTVGIIDATWGGTPAEAWTPANALLDQAGYQQQAQSILAEPSVWQNRFDRANELAKQKQQLIDSEHGVTKLGLASAEFDDTNWQEVNIPSADIHQHVVWLRRSFEISNNSSDAQVHLGWFPDTSRVFINGTEVFKKKGKNPTGSFVIPKGLLTQGENQIAFRTVNGWNNQTSLNKPNYFKFESKTETVSLLGKWRFNNRIEGELPMPKRYFQSPSVLYNAMIHPLKAYPIKGVIWYQGESNAKRHSEYHQLFSSLITSWRQRWQQPELPFIFAQLASNRAHKKTPYESDWALLRQAQTDTLGLLHTGMAVLVDVGDQWDIHPRDKKTVGERLYKSAQHVAYQQDVVYSGPVVEDVKRVKNQMVVSFSHVASGLVAQGELQDFAIADASGKFHNANARIDGNSVVVWADSISTPTAVQYGWADFTYANLYNKAGLPAVPFRKYLEEK